MTEALVPKVIDAVVITSEQTTLIKQTIAPGATDAELQLFFYDNRRRGVHPLDKLIHFTKRKGKYVPVTSIDFFRSRAAMTGEHVGTDDAVFTGQPGDPEFAATVTVYRRVLGDRCAFTATARFTEYQPEEDFMWRRMPHSQIAKCAEGLALRKGFPQELDGLHTVEEMAGSERDDPAAAAPAAGARARVPRISDKKAEPVVEGEALIVTAPVKVRELETKTTTRGPLFICTCSDGIEYTTRTATHGEELAQFKGTDHFIRISYRERPWKGKTYRNIEHFVIADIEMRTMDGQSTHVPTAPGAPLLADDIFGGAKD